jgi:hypothetical protein
MSSSPDANWTLPSFPSVPSLDDLIALNEQVIAEFEEVVVDLDKALSKFDKALSGLGDASRN